MTSLNWQVYDRGMQVNEAMFVSSPGWVEKPLHMRKGSECMPKGGREKIIGEVIGVSSCSYFSAFFLFFFLFSCSSLTQIPQCQLLADTPVNPFPRTFVQSYSILAVIWNGVPRR